MAPAFDRLKSRAWRPSRACRAASRAAWCHGAPLRLQCALSWQARPRDFAVQIGRRRKYLLEKIAFEQDALTAIIGETSPSSDAAMIVRLAIRQQEVELAWLDEVASRHRPG